MTDEQIKKEAWEYARNICIGYDKKMTELLYIDLFCGAGGTSTGVERARIDGKKCARVIACVNHDPNAIKSHATNHPNTKHFTEDIRTLDMKPLQTITDKERAKNPGAKVVLWASLDTKKS